MHVPFLSGAVNCRSYQHRHTLESSSACFVLFSHFHFTHGTQNVGLIIHGLCFSFFRHPHIGMLFLKGFKLGPTQIGRKRQQIATEPVLCVINRTTRDIITFVLSESESETVLLPGMFTQTRNFFWRKVQYLDMTNKQQSTRQKDNK